MCRGAMRRLSHEQRAQTMKTAPVERSVSPMPTSGDTMPPNEKQMAPSMAEAVPAYSRAAPMASAVEEVKVSPMAKSRPKSSPSLSADNLNY